MRVVLHGWCHRREGGWLLNADEPPEAVLLQDVLQRPVSSRGGKAAGTGDDAVGLGGKAGGGDSYRTISPATVGGILKKQHIAHVSRLELPLCALQCFILRVSLLHRMKIPSVTALWTWNAPATWWACMPNDLTAAKVLALQAPVKTKPVHSCSDQLNSLIASWAQ